jgi:hypothetical protein
MRNETEVVAAELFLDPTPDWDAFAARQSGISFLEHNPIYSLSAKLISAIRRQAPGFFKPNEFDFELALARTASFGFVNKRPLGRCTDESNPRKHADDEADERHRESRRQIDEMQASIHREKGATDLEIAEAINVIDKRRQAISEQKEAYVGWLLLNADFRSELAALRCRWQKAIADAGGFPRTPMWAMSRASESLDLPPICHDEFVAFYARWNLETLTTWDWPIAMEADLIGGLRPKDYPVSEAGIWHFVPWYLMRGAKVDLQDTVRAAHLSSIPRHLRPWLEGSGPTAKHALGQNRYAHTVWLYRYRFLALERRYGPRMNRRVSLIDDAFGKVLHRQADSIKQIRLLLAKHFGA